jgi:rhamnosyl/mannosyltransferase
MSRRILVTIPYFPPDPKAGGAEMFVVSMVEGLTVDHGWEVTIVTSTPKNSIEVEAGPGGARVYRLPHRIMLSNSPISISWYRELKRLIEKVDPNVVNINIPVPGLGDMTSHVAGRRPTVVYYHFGSMKKGSLALDPLIWVYETLVLPVTLNPAQHIVCGSAYVRDGILSKFRDKTSIVPPGVDTVRFHPAPCRNVDPHVLYVGSLNASDQHKRFPDLLEAVAILRADLPELKLSAVGGGDGQQRYQEMAVRLGIDDMVQFHGRLEGDSLAEAYRNAAVLAVPSLRETFGMVITEAMASGLPVVAVNAGGVPTVVADNKDGLLVPPRDPRAMAAALRDILTDHDRADLLGKAGREKVSSLLTWEHQIASMNAIFAAAAGLPALNPSPGELSRAELRRGPPRGSATSSRCWLASRPRSQSARAGHRPVAAR